MVPAVTVAFVSGAHVGAAGVVWADVAFALVSIAVGCALVAIAVVTVDTGASVPVAVVVTCRVGVTLVAAVSALVSIALGCCVVVVVVTAVTAVNSRHQLVPQVTPLGTDGAALALGALSVNNRLGLHDH